MTWAMLRRCRTRQGFAVDRLVGLKQDDLKVQNKVGRLGIQGVSRHGNARLYALQRQTDAKNAPFTTTFSTIHLSLFLLLSRLLILLIEPCNRSFASYLIFPASSPC